MTDIDILNALKKYENKEFRQSLQSFDSLNYVHKITSQYDEWRKVGFIDKENIGNKILSTLMSSFISDMNSELHNNEYTLKLFANSISNLGKYVNKGDQYHQLRFYIYSRLCLIQLDRSKLKIAKDSYNSISNNGYFKIAHLEDYGKLFMNFGKKKESLKLLNFALDIFQKNQFKKLANQCENLIDFVTKRRISTIISLIAMITLGIIIYFKNHVFAVWFFIYVLLFIPFWKFGRRLNFNYKIVRSLKNFPNESEDLGKRMFKRLLMKRKFNFYYRLVIIIIGSVSLFSILHIEGYRLYFSLLSVLFICFPILLGIGNQIFTFGITQE